MNTIMTISELQRVGMYPMAISRSVKKQKLGNYGYGFYQAHPNVLTFDEDTVMAQIHTLLKSFPLPPKNVVFCSSSLNFCINQQISSPTYLVEVEKKYLFSVFESLKSIFPNRVVLFRPNQEDKLNYWRPGAIYVIELFKRGPLDPNGRMSIEKLVVDLLCDEDLYSFYSGIDIEYALDTLCSRYVINYRTLFAYASRKGKRDLVLKRIRQYIPEGILTLLENKKTK